MSRRIRSKTYTEHGRQEHERIFGPPKRETEQEGSVEVLADGPGGYADLKSVPPIPPSRHGGESEKGVRSHQ